MSNIQAHVLVALIPYKFPLHLGNCGLIFCIANWWAQPKKFLAGFHLLNLFTTVEGEGGHSSGKEGETGRITLFWPYIWADI